MKLRYYQEEAVQSIWTYFQGSSGNPIIALPTGTGKSIVIAELVKRICTQYQGQRIMKLTHVKELIEQNFEKLISLWPSAPAGIYSAGLNRKDVDKQIIFAGIASVAKCPEAFGHIDLIIIDECHLVSPNQETMYRAFIQKLLSVNPYLKVIGLTATPYRLKTGVLTEDGIFTDICYDRTTMAAFNQLVDDGFLSPLVPKATKTELDLEGVRTTAGEYNQKDLAAKVDIDLINNSAVNEIMTALETRNKCLIFATSIEHCIHLVDLFDSYDIPAKAVHSKMKAAERDQILRDFKMGRIPVLINRDILTTGFDCPDVDLIGVLRPTKSASLWVQMLGRGTRIADGKSDCLVLDFAGNTARLGPVNDPVIPRSRKQGKGSPSDAPVRLCEECNTYVHASLRVCPHCGHEFPVNNKLSVMASTRELIKRDDTPEVVDLQVSQLTFRPHVKAGRPTSLKATYHCGLRTFHNYICLEHQGYAQVKAGKWWKELGGLDPVPKTVNEALERDKELMVPATIRVWINKKYPEIMGHGFAE